MGPAAALGGFQDPGKQSRVAVLHRSQALEDVPGASPAPLQEVLDVFLEWPVQEVAAAATGRNGGEPQRGSEETGRDDLEPRQLEPRKRSQE